MVLTTPFIIDIFGGINGGNAKTPGQNADHGTSGASMNLSIIFDFLL